MDKISMELSSRSNTTKVEKSGSVSNGEGTFVIGIRFCHPVRIFPRIYPS
ncbi:MAG: hypothetical protein ACI4UA_08190 [Bacteroidaceae bacterium]